MGEDVERETLGHVVVKTTEAGDVASESLQASSVKKIALRNAKIAGVKHILTENKLKCKKRPLGIYLTSKTDSK